MKNHRVSVWVSAALLSAVFYPDALRAAVAPERPHLENVDVRGKREAEFSPAQAVAEQALKAQAGNVEVVRDTITGGPRTITAKRGFLTAPGGVGAGVSAAAVAAFPANDSARVVKAFLTEHRGLFGHGPEALAGAKVLRDYTDAHNGLHTFVWQQQLDGISVFEATFKAHLTKLEELVSLASSFLPDVTAAGGADAAARAALIAKPKVSAAQAISAAAAGVGDEVAAEAILAIGAADGAESRQNFKAPKLTDLEARLVWLPMDATTMRLCWQAVFMSHSRHEMFLVLIDAEKGETLLRHGLTNYISNATYNVYTSDSPSPFSPGHATPNSTQPPVVARSLVTISALDTTASPNGWIDDGVTETRGNNVDAHTDLNDDDLPDLPRPTNAGRVFNFPLDLALAPSTYSAAVVTDLFYWNNVIHDRYYQLGFTESAGNFQNNNFGRGGLGNDAVAADAQDGASLNDGFHENNANFSTPPDGTPGRMQMFLFPGPTPDRDGSLDHEIVIHEYTHGLSNRLVGGGVGMSALASEGMGEGWSDFYGLCLLAEAGDNPNGNFAAGGYATYQLDASYTQNYYYGIRRYPYSTDLTKNPLTYKDIDPGQASAHTGIARSPIIGNTANEVHNIGEVWCVTLWEARANLIAARGFAGNQLILQLVTDGMKLAPANPTLLEARDAIIQADTVLTGGANYNALWAAFAKRGMGDGATAPASSTTTGVHESFDLPDNLEITPAAGLSSRGPVGGPFTPSGATYTLRNAGSAALSWTAAASQTWLTLSPASGTLAANASVQVILSINGNANALAQGVFTGTATFTNTTSGASRTRSASLGIGLEFFTELFVAGTDPNDTALATYTFTPTGGSPAYLATRNPASSFPTDPAGGTALALGDDAFSLYTLSGGAQVRLFGVSYSSIYVGSNGYVTFIAGDTGLSEGIADHFAVPRIAALYDDLNPGVSGSVSVRQLADRVAVTWQNVPQFSTADSNSFQIEMFFDGRIAITVLAIAATDGLIGLSPGTGTPPLFIESNFSAYPTPAFVTLTLPASVTEGGVSSTGTVSATPIPTANLTVTLSNPATGRLSLPATVVIPASQASASFAVSAVNDALLNGSPLVTVGTMVTGYVGGSGTVRVVDNETTTLTVTLPASAAEGATGLTGSVSTGASVAAAVAVSLSSNDLTEVTVPTSVTIPAGQSSVTFPLTILDDAVVDGTQSATITAQVAGWTSGSKSMTITDVGVRDSLTELFDSTTNDTAGATYTFIPSAVASGYLATRIPASAFPTDPTGGTAFVFSDDDSSLYTLTGGAQVRLFGVSYSAFYVGSNGYVTFTAGDTDYVETLANHFRLPRISALFDDLTPAAGGSVSARQLGDRVAVTWQNVPEYSTTNANSFQIEMFFDGRITITILAIAAQDGLIGLSRGSGTPADFVESDFSAFPNGFDRLASWRALQGLASNGSQDLGNPSADGVSNLLKYALHLAPLLGDLARPNARVLSNPAGVTLAELTGLPFTSFDAQRRLTIVFLRRKATNNSGIGYNVEFSNLAQPFAVNPAATVAVFGVDATWERVTVTDSVSAPGTRFLRLGISILP